MDSTIFSPITELLLRFVWICSAIRGRTKNKPFLYNDKDIQDFNSEACGYYCLAFIKFLHDKNDKELAFKEFLKMFGKKTIENDNVLKKYLDID